ncbi:MAG: hypothetical protein AAF411_05825 [Myxococcota bacterium]
MGSFGRRVLWIAVVCAGWGCGASQARAPRAQPDVDYRLSARFDPTERAVQAVAKFHHSGTEQPLRFFLNHALEVDAIFVDGRMCEFAWDDDARMEYVDAARLVVAHCRHAQADALLEVRYHGVLGESYFDVNQLSDGLVELAVYAAWYPILHEGRSSFTYELSVEVPTDYISVSRGRLADSQSAGDGYRRERWVASIPGRDIPYFAARGATRVRVEHGSASLELVFRDFDHSHARRFVRSGRDSLAYFTHLFGEPRSSTLRLVLSPRGGWGYSRSGMVVMSEERAASQWTSPDPGEPADGLEHNLAHEIAHAWWSLADVDEDDWINEALAEYAATRDSERRNADRRIEWMRHFVASVSGREAAPPILRTDASSRFRYVNWYEKGALFFLCMEEEIGTDRLVSALRELHAETVRGELRTADLVARLEAAGASQSWLRGWLHESSTDPLVACMRAHDAR